MVSKSQLNSEWIYEVNVSSKMPTKNNQDFCPGSLLEGRAEILKVLVGIWGGTMTSQIYSEFNRPLANKRNLSQNLSFFSYCLLVIDDAYSKRT